MRISFDLDDTLICADPKVPRERVPSWHRRICALKEPMRLGTCDLVAELRSRNWEIWIYTTSLRSVFSIRRWLHAHGVTVDGVINQRVHARKLGDWKGRRPSKNPALFGMDLHVDDLDGVRLEGQTHGFDVVVVEPANENWTNIVLDAANHMTMRCTPSNGV